MSVWRLVTREIRFRLLHFLLGVIAATAAVGCLVGAFTLLRAFDLRTEWLLAAKRADLKVQMKQMEDDYRKIALGLGFNVLILPRDQNLGDLYANDYASKLMPEEWVERLSRASVITVAHLLPVLQQKVRWPEQQRTILLTGTRGEVPIAMARAKQPLLENVPRGMIVLGYELHRGAGLKVGDRVTFFGRPFKVVRCNPERGSKDDITAWIGLKEAQEILKQPGRINAIFALGCQCEGERLATIRREIAGILPDTQVIEFASQAVARAEARERAATATRESLEAEERSRAKLRSEREGLAAILVPLILVGCTLWIGLLAFGNVRERRAEIGILRALGLRSGQVLLLFQARALAIGVVGAVLGYAIGSLVGLAGGGAGLKPADVVDLRLLGVVLVLAPVLTALASWVPATMAAQEDPAVVLAEE